MVLSREKSNLVPDGGSSIKRMGKTLSYPSLRNFVKIEITRLILERFGQVDAMAGVATGASPQGEMCIRDRRLPDGHSCVRVHAAWPTVRYRP